MKEFQTAISYARKSVQVIGKQQEEGVSYQLYEIKKYAEREGLNIIKQFSDVGYSGSNLERPELHEMLEFLMQNSVDVLLIYSVDRFGRDMLNNVELMLNISKYVKRIVFVKNGMSNSEEYFKFFFLIETSIAQQERINLLERCSDGRRAKIIKGKEYHGRYPLGYVRSLDGQRIEPASSLNTNDYMKIQESLMLQFIIYCYLGNMSLREIATLVQKRFGNTRLGKKWSHKSVRYILNNPIYSGVLAGSLEKYDNYMFETDRIVPLIDPLMHNLIQMKLRLENPGRKHKSKNFQPFYCLCKKCRLPLKIMDDFVSCPDCNENLPLEFLAKKLEEKTKKVLENKYLKSDSDTEKLVLQYEAKKVKVERQLEQLVKHKAEIVKSDFDSLHNKNDLLKINSKEKVACTSDLLEIKKILELLKGPIKNDDVNVEYLLSIPFVIVVSFSDKLINVIFHRNILAKMSS